MHCSPSNSSVWWIFQARTLKWVAIPFSRWSFWSRDWTLVSCIAVRFFTIWAIREDQCEKEFSLISLRYGFPGGTSCKALASQCKRHKRWGLDPWLGKTPFRRAWQPTPISLPGEFHGHGAWWATVHGVAKSWTWLKRLSTHACKDGVCKDAENQKLEALSNCLYQ